MTTAPGWNAVAPPRHSVWLRELPFSLVLIATVLGVAYTSISSVPIVVYWEALAPAIGLVCIVSGWQQASDRADPGGTLGLVSRRNEFVSAAWSAEAFQRQCDRACSFYFADARYFHRWAPGPALADLPIGSGDGPQHSRNRLDRKYRLDCTSHIRRRSEHRPSRVVALAAKVDRITRRQP
jgi:hypothetical protein